MLNFLLFSYFSLILACSQRAIVSANNQEKIKLFISSDKKTTSDSLLITISLENKTQNELNILNRRDVSFSNIPVLPWGLEVLFVDSIRKISSINYLINVVMPTAKDYYPVKPGNKYEFQFTIDFSKLARVSSKIGTANDDYGEYSIKVFYKDSFCKHKRAIRGSVVSNKIFVRNAK